MAAPVPVVASSKRCVLSVRGSQGRHGVVADTLHELQDKALQFLNLAPGQEKLTLVLAEDGTIVEDEEYFLCLPEDTVFLILKANETWAPTSVVDGGTAWMARDSVDKDDVDGAQAPKWKVLAAQLKENLSNIVLFSESDFQILIGVKTEELSAETGMSPRKTEMLKETLQRLLDRREEERQSKELLQLYLEAVKKDEVDGPKVPGTSEEKKKESAEAVTTSLKTKLPSSVLSILKEKKLPHLSLSNEQLEAVCAQDPAALSVDLNCSLQGVHQMQTGCKEQLKLRYEQACCMNTLAPKSQKKTTTKTTTTTTKNKKAQP